ncbi:unnamed protein product [Boreogadus saida]
MEVQAVECGIRNGTSRTTPWSDSDEFPVKQHGVWSVRFGKDVESEDDCNDPPTKDEGAACAAAAATWLGPPPHPAWGPPAQGLNQQPALSLSAIDGVLPDQSPGETKILKLKNLRPQDYANYSCIASVRNVCGIPDRSVIFRLTNKTASPTIKLLVEDPIVVNPGQTVSLVCITTGGEPSPLLNWASSNDSLPPRSLVKGGTLTLPAITSDEAGVYSCVASNNVGNPAKKSTTIVVRVSLTGFLHHFAALSFSPWITSLPHNLLSPKLVNSSESQTCLIS